MNGLQKAEYFKYVDSNLQNSKNLKKLIRKQKGGGKERKTQSSWEYRWWQYQYLSLLTRKEPE